MNGRTGLPPSGRYGLGGLDDARARTLLEKVSRSRVRGCFKPLGPRPVCLDGL